MTHQSIFDTTKNLSGKPVDIKQHNQRLVLSLLREEHTLPGSELAVRTGLSKTTISKILTELVSRNLIVSMGKGDSTTEGGKKPELFAINARYAATIVMTLASMKSMGCAVVDLCGEILYEKDYPLPEDGDYDYLISIMAQAIQAAEVFLETQNSAVCGIAIGYGGVTNTETGEILYPLCSPHCTAKPLRDDLLRQHPTNNLLYIDNVCHFSGNAELLLKENRNLDHLAVISCDDIVNGCSLASPPKGRPGARGIVGEFGHLIIDPSASTHCYCGCKGCLESLVSKRAVMARGRKLSHDFPYSELAVRMQKEDVSVEKICEAACANDPYAQEILWPVIKYLSILIRSMVVLENVSKVIIQGMYARLGNAFLDMIRSEVYAYNSLIVHKTYTVEFSHYSQKGPDEDKRACVCGASYYTSNFYLDNLIASFNEI